MEKIFDLKFIVPPTLFIVLVSIANPHFSLYLFENREYSAVILASIILSLGFIISSIIYFIVNLLHLTVTPKDNKEPGCKCLNSFLKLKEDKVKQELRQWKNQSRNENGNFISNQLSKRWDMAISNFNSCLALFFAFLFVLYFRSWIWVIIIILFCIFFYNGYLAFYSVHKINQRLKNRGS